MDWHTGQMRSGKIVVIKDAQVTVHEDGTRSQWKLSYAAIDPGADSDRSNAMQERAGEFRLPC